MRTSLQTLLVLLACQLICTGCDGDLADSPEPGYFTLSVAVRPGQLSITQNDTLRVSFESVRMYRGPDLVLWSVIADTPQAVNLFDYAHGDTLSLGDQNVTYLPPGDYAQLRVKIILADTLMRFGGRVYKSSIPPSFDPIVRIDTPVPISSGNTVSVLLTMECDSSLTFTQGWCLFTPTFTVR